ncbi:MAG: class I SAM-dependent methyltransferase [Pseudomonadota bacterium]
MGGDDETLDFYTREATAYADHVLGELEKPWLPRFAAMVRPGGRVLDFGCGPGWAANWLVQQGFVVDAFDGSEGFAEEARRRYGLSVTVGRFEEFAAPLAHYDGIWCCFSLLHDTREAMPGHLGRLAAALAPGGAFYIGLKEGTEAERDTIGRLYTFFGRDEMRDLLADAGFDVIGIDSEDLAGFDGTPSTGLHIYARRA